MPFPYRIMSLKCFNDRHRQAVGMDVEAIVTVEVRLNAGHGRACAQQGLQDAAPLFLFVGSGAVVLPAQLLCTVLFLRGGVFIAADVGGRAFHNIQSIHRVCPFHTVFSQGLYHILCRCVIHSISNKSPNVKNKKIGQEIECKYEISLADIFRKYNRNMFCRMKKEL